MGVRPLGWVLCAGSYCWIWQSLSHIWVWLQVTSHSVQDSAIPPEPHISRPNPTGCLCVVEGNPELVVSRKCSQETKEKIAENLSHLPVCSGTHVPSNHQLIWLLLLQEQVRGDLTISHRSDPLSSCPWLFPLVRNRQAPQGLTSVEECPGTAPLPSEAEQAGFIRRRQQQWEEKCTLIRSRVAVSLLRTPPCFVFPLACAAHRLCLAHMGHAATTVPEHCSPCPTHLCQIHSWGLLPWRKRGQGSPDSSLDYPQPSVKAPVR